MNPRGRPRRPLVRTAELLALLREDVRPSEIARRFGVSPAAVTQAIKALPRATLFELLTQRAVAAPVPQTPPPSPPPVDVMAVILGVHQRLEQLHAFLESPEAIGQLKLSQRLQLQLTTIERTLRWAEAFLDTNKHLLDLMGVDLWMQELGALLDDVDPTLKERLKERVRARGLVRSVPG